ncbi:unnamed protein product [Leptosia nina]|uniref:DNA endonuclease RBBP8 n=1 Tax=Leptosia nina TaxID=320188 RepID=A0AAV1JNJ6_9NEOP
MSLDLLIQFPSSSPRFKAAETTLQQTVQCFKELAEEYDKLVAENMDYKSKYQALMECSSNTSSDALKREVEQKNNIIQQVASALSKLLETKDFKIIDEIFMLICGDLKQKLGASPKESKVVQDKSLSEVEGTPGRKSPIIAMSKKIRSSTTHSLNLTKKCDGRDTPEKKNSLKLVFPSPSKSKGGGRMKQSRLNVMKSKSSCVVDLTCSPEARLREDDVDMKLVKKELIDYDETILPSPTSGALVLPQMYKSTKDSPNKFQKPTISINIKAEKETRVKDDILSATYTQQIDLMKSCKRSLQLIKTEKTDENVEYDVNNSVSLLQQKSPQSPKKQPLLLNNNLMNIQDHMESSMSILQKNKVSPTNNQPGVKAKRTKVEDAGPVYKEPTVRKKSEKRALPGWSCDKCKQFYGTLYADNPDMLAQKMDECSKHRGRNNPVRPSTPPGFWEPRWDVPTDTEEFNRRNNAI